MKYIIPFILLLAFIGCNEDTVLPPAASAYILTITPANAAEGTLTARTGGIEIVSGIEVEAGATISLSAAPKSGYVFLGFIINGVSHNGILSGLSYTCNFIMTRETSVSAEFGSEADYFSLTLTQSDFLKGTFTAAVNNIKVVTYVGKDQIVVLTAVPVSGYKFVKFVVNSIDQYGVRNGGSYSYEFPMTGPAAVSAVFAVQTMDMAAASLLLSRLDLTQPGLVKVLIASISEDYETAIEELLDYYHTRTSVKSSVDRLQKAASLGNCATAENLQIADNALNHVFVGQPAYPPYFCGDDINWNTRPVSDMEWVWQLNRMTFWEDMGKAYWHTGNEQYVSEWVSQLTDWVKKNPVGTSYSWRYIEAGERSTRWVSLFQYFIDSPAFTGEFLVTFLNSCFDHAEFLHLWYSSGSNWGLIESRGLGYLGIMFPEFRTSEKWVNKAIERFNTEVVSQFYSDGYHKEMTPSYHRPDYFMAIIDMAQMNGRENIFPESLWAMIEKMVEAQMVLGLPNGTAPMFGDTSRMSAWGQLRENAARFKRPDFLYVASYGSEGTKPDATAFALPVSGFYSMRSGWDRNAICLIMKNGPNGGGHCQPDNGTFELYAGGCYLMPDSGTYTYDENNPDHFWFRQTKVHQTLTLDGRDTAYYPKQLFWSPGEDLDVAVVENQSYQDLGHRRAVFFVDKSFFIIVDEAIGSATGDVAIHFQLVPGDAVLDIQNLTAKTVFTEGWNVQVTSVISDGAVMKEEQGQVSFSYTQKEDRPAFCYQVNKAGTGWLRFVTLVVPYNGMTAPDIDVALAGSPAVGSNTLNLQVTTGGMSRQIGYSF